MGTEVSRKKEGSPILGKNADLSPCVHTGTGHAGAPVGAGAGNASLFYRQGNRGTEKPHKVMVDKWQSQDLNAVTLTPEPRDSCVLVCVPPCICGREGGTHFSTRAPLLSQASSCAAAMSLGRWGPRATRLSGTDRAAVPRLGTPNLPLSLAAFPRPLPWQPF